MKSQGNATSMSRASFVAGAGVAAAGIATAGLSAATRARADEAAGASAEPAWDKEVDFLVVGSGTGAYAALRALNLGAERVLVIEKTAVWGGTSIMSEGGFGFPMTRQAAEAGVEDSVDEVVRYYANASEGRADEAVVRSWCENGQGFIDWTGEQLGWQWTFDTSFPLFGCDYYEPVDGWKELGRSTVATVDADGNSMTAARRWDMLRSAYEGLGGEVMMETTVTSLVTDAGGAVIGVCATCADGSEIAVRADAVLLATGGFERNDEMRRKYLSFPVLAACTSAGNTGDGQRMGAAIGAQLSNMGCFFGIPCILTTGDDPDQLLADNAIATEVTGCDWALYRNMPGAIVVNRKGRRFGDEGTGYDPFTLTFAAYDNYEKRRANIPAYFICDSDCWGRYSLPGHSVSGTSNAGFGMSEADGAEEEALAEYYVKADSLGELAEQLGIDADGLVDEVARFNGFAEAGVDEDFHRGELTFDQQTVTLLGAARDDMPNPCIAPLATPPFYGAVYVPGTYSTSGGLQINENAQVVNVNGEVIGGLYACGNCSSGVSGGRYVNGIALASGSTMGWVAAGHALAPAAP